MGGGYEADVIDLVATERFEFNCDIDHCATVRRLGTFIDDVEEALSIG